MPADKHNAPRADPRTDPLLQSVPEIEGYKVLDRRYVLFETLGVGGMGVVFRAKHTDLGIEVAIKCLDPSLVRRNDEFVARFKKEARAAAQIQHENVVRVVDVADDVGLHYLVMEFVEGEDARRRVARKGPLPPEEAASITLGAAHGLASAHSAGLVHRDIKPDNVLIGVDGRVKVADLGLAKQVDAESGLTYSGATMGTPRYMPPEQFGDAKNVGPAADVYSLGATLYFLLTGEDGVPGGSLLEVADFIRSQPFPDPRAVRPDTPAALAELVLSWTKKDPGERPSDAAAAVKELERAHYGTATELADPKAGMQGTASMVSPPPPDKIIKIRKTVIDSRAPQPLEPERAVEESKSERGGRRVLLAVASIALLAVVALVAQQRGLFTTAPGDDDGGTDGPVADQDEDPATDAGTGAGTVADPELSDDEVASLMEASVDAWAEVVEARPDPSVVTDADARQRIEASGLPWKVRDKASGIVLLLVPPGECVVGESPGDTEAFSDEGPAHRVRLDTPFYLGRTEVTQAEWQRVMNDEPSFFSGSDRPVERVSWDRINATDEGFLARTGLRLPRECEWEYACRAGTDGSRYGPLATIAWYVDTAMEGTQEVALKAANAWGFHDMLGNVYEWSSNAHDWDFYASAKEREPVVPTLYDTVDGDTRVLRGGSWVGGARSVRASNRYRLGPEVSSDDVGFRVARTP